MRFNRHLVKDDTVPGIQSTLVRCADRGALGIASTQMIPVGSLRKEGHENDQPAFSHDMFHDMFVRQSRRLSAVALHDPHLPRILTTRLVPVALADQLYQASVKPVPFLTILARFK
jgi:hypothetical protein